MSIRHHKPIDNNFVFVLVILAVYFIEIIRTAWISDDAAITLRTVMNFLHGYGLRFNIDERVQAYTHPLWMFLISALTLIFQNVFTATFIASIGLSLLGVWLLLKYSRGGPHTILIIGISIILSKSFIDFSTSGLENPLSNLIILGCFSLGLQLIQKDGCKSLTLFFLLNSLAYLTRADLLVLLIPLTLVVIYQKLVISKNLKLFTFIGFAPVFVWTLFSLYYYGFAFPNTAYAKLGTGIELSERIQQGTKYFLHSFETDPLTLFVILLGIFIGFNASKITKLIALGIVFYIFYTISIGGDFMEGRFLNILFFSSLFILALANFSQFQFLLVIIFLLILGIPNINKTLLSNASYENTQISIDGIADERGHYYQLFGLLSPNKGVFADLKWKPSEKKVEVICGGLGFKGLKSGPSTHFIDACALADPLLARLPAKYDPNWRIGHFYRLLPTEYERSILLDQNLLSDPQTRLFWEEIRTITRKNLNDYQRLKSVLNFNLGQVAKPDPLIYRGIANQNVTFMNRLSINQLQNIRSGGTWDQAGNFLFKRELLIDLDKPTSFKTIDVSLDNNDEYAIQILEGSTWKTVATIYPTKGSGLVRHRIKLSNNTPSVQFVRIQAITGDDKYSVGHFLLK